jgi:hypothetical protein
MRLDPLLPPFSFLPKDVCNKIEKINKKIIIKRRRVRKCKKEIETNK